LFDRPGNPYLDPDGREWGDNALRFAALSWSAARIGQGLDPHWIPDVIHCHDWHTGLTPAYVRAHAQTGGHTPATVFTIHNLAYRGIFPGAVFPQLGLPKTWFDINGVEFYGQVCYLKAALQYADWITTVSPTYAREIMTDVAGWGLDGLLRARSHVLSGILNGVDYQVWNPATDALLATHFDAGTLAAKALAKQSLQNDFGLQRRAGALVFAVISRLTEQKGLHLLLEVVDSLIQQGGQLVLLGQGEAWLEQVFTSLARQYPSQIGVQIGYDEKTAHRIVAGADVMLMPSAFEPCGLTQMYSLRYGTLPLVRAVGGLADTVVDCTPLSLAGQTATGFVFQDFNAEALRHAMQRAFALAQRPDEWASVQRRGMALRFDWLGAAQHYVFIYQSLCAGQ
jgi:starch synthase